MTLQTTTAGFGKLLEPGLRKIFFETYPEKSEQFNKIFNVNTSKKAREYDLSLGGFKPWESKDEGAAITYQDPVSGYEIVYKHDSFASGFVVTREMHDDEQYNIINKFPKNLARAGRTKVETDAAAVLNSGFDGVTREIYDGKALFAADHPLKGGGSASNLATGALTDANLKLAIKQMHDIPDEVGNKIAYTPNKLVVPRSLEFVAKEIVNSNQKAGTNNNDINTVKGALEVVVYDYLTDDKAWFIMDSSVAQLNWFWRIKPEFKHEEDFDTLNAKYRGYTRYSVGVSDFRGIVGSKGA
ncbi:Mu-like prophage major head subunit gpT family protein [Bacillus sp. DTU_2020_1000418_1_SI_GHA_SEK_038]|uniref:phage major capsid protein n=1 Tax=Bacillus sp. DTU_2020_1000418_1_SI_GHA_SEK_038 TaxID=3077585 RepID=UPI0028EAAE74|nr:Mu-like prophage major head subunit gpT family protein [Bacillus sp. DTU_2020_1000418_1_SI_GHA_SEK_038]WNS74238.1 Mu-like prophage major head subunit gpT family protein [Bacillus sp. DTU_2020_1000418_1_SI_GHA_SEK_038]